MRDDHFETRILDFERAWQRGAPPDVARFRAEPLPLLVELVSIDLEFRWRQRDARPPRTLEDYAAALPALAPLPHELIAEEYRCRCRWGDGPSHKDMLARFPEGGNALRTLLTQVDRELAEEAGGATWPAMPPPDAPLLSDRAFRLERMIGAGLTGKVYRASRLADARAVALKFLRKTWLDHPALVERFLAEARVVGRLRHPHIVPTLGLGRTAAGSYFIAMELIDGPNLAEVLRRRAVTVDEAVRWTIQTCAALAHAHATGVVHCDLKPANILLDANDLVRVTDFGLAREVYGTGASTAAIAGTAPFMAPEQVSGAVGPITERTDVYGLGAVLYALLTGRPPRTGGDRNAILADVAGGGPIVAAMVLRPMVPTAISDVCQRCLAHAPDDRPPTMDAVRAALERALCEP